MRGNAGRRRIALLSTTTSIAEDLGGEAGLAQPAIPRLGLTSSAWPVTCVPTTWASILAFPRGPPRWFPRPEPPLPGLLVHRTPTCRRRTGPGSCSRTITGRQRCGGSSSRTQRDRREADVEHEMTERASRGNDTAPLDFLDAAGLRQVIRTILDVAGRFLDHPFAMRPGPRQEAHRAAVWPVPGHRASGSLRVPSTRSPRRSFDQRNAS